MSSGGFYIGVRYVEVKLTGASLQVRFGEGKTRSHNRIIATAPAPELAKVILAGSEGDHKAPQRTTRLLQQHNYAVTVMVVNLYYDQPDLIPYHGFGYLIPRSIPFDQNPERALGVIFGTDSSAGQDSAPGTKFTVMMGGHWWDDWIESDYPDPDTAISMARSLLERHLGIKEAPSVAKAQLQRNAIPQYTVGHLSRMDDLSQAVREEFNQRLTLAGNWYSVHGVGVIDCITQAYNAASYGVGAHRPDLSGRMTKPLSRINYRDWDLEGGIATAPVRYFIGTAEDAALYLT
jgi:oxygen-dependent protoporphyrinogen oxidase